MESVSRKQATEATRAAGHLARAKPRLAVIRGFVFSDGFLFLLVMLGILLRVAVYLDNRPFWTDEAQLALNIRSKTMFQLFGHLDFCQAAPPGFLAIEKLLTTMIGESELVLRIVPLVAGICSLPLFVLLAKRTVRRSAVVLAVAMFAICEPLIRYATELKQYSVDVLCGLILWLLAAAVLADKSPVRVLVGLALVGAMSPWFSFASILVLTAIAVVGLVRAVVERRARDVVIWSFIAALWAISIAGVYSTSLSGLIASSAKAALMDEKAVVPHDMSCVGWLLNKSFEILQFPVGITGLGAGVAAIGVVLGFFQVVRRRKLLAVSISFPLLLALIGSWLALYPLFGRFLLFTVPVFQLFIAEGAVSIPLRFCRGSSLINAIAIMLLFLPGLDLLDRDEHGINRRWTNVRGALQYIQAHKRSGDLIYVYYGAYFPTMYYCPYVGMKEENLVIGVPGYWWNSDLRKTLLTAWQKSEWRSGTPSEEVFHAYGCGEFSHQWHVYESDLQRLTGHSRVWTIFSLSNWCGSDEEKLFLYFLDKRGRRLDAYRTAGASAYLYDLAHKHVDKNTLIGSR